MDRTARSVLYIFFKGETQMKSPTFRGDYPARKRSLEGLFALGTARVLAHRLERPDIWPELLEVLGERGEGGARIAALPERAEKDTEPGGLGVSRGNQAQLL